MDKYAKLKEDNTLYYAPVNYKLEDGRIIANFNKSVKMMVRYGFKLVVEEMPEYNYNTHYIEINNCIEEDNCIRVIYIAVEIPKNNIESNN